MIYVGVPRTLCSPIMKKFEFHHMSKGVRRIAIDPGGEQQVRSGEMEGHCVRCVRSATRCT
jgi:hypothetical protein